MKQKHPTQSIKEQATLESALGQTDKRPEKVSKELDDPEDAKCYACGQDLSDEKVDEIQNKLQTEYGETTYLMEINEKAEKVKTKLAEIGELSDKSTHS